MGKVVWSVEFAYTPDGVDVVRNVDAVIAAIAERHGGTWQYSEFGADGRLVGYTFPTRAAARRAARDVKNRGEVN